MGSHTSLSVFSGLGCGNFLFVIIPNKSSSEELLSEFWVCKCSLLICFPRVGVYLIRVVLAVRYMLLKDFYEVSQFYYFYYFHVLL